MSTLVIAEHDNSSLKKSTLNTITAASAVGEPVDVLIAGADCQAAAAAAAGVAGVRAVIVADGRLSESAAGGGCTSCESGIRRLFASVCCSHYGRKEFDASCGSAS